MNRMAETRAYIERCFELAQTLPWEHLSEPSPSGIYLLNVDMCAGGDSKHAWGLAVATITERLTGEVVAQVTRDDDRFWHCWIECNGVEYMVCSEDTEGQTVIDLTHRRVESYAASDDQSDDQIVWVEFYPSPSRMRLAVVGCHWGGPYFTAVYDFHEPMELPLKRIAEVCRKGFDFREWIGDTQICLADENGNEEIVTTP
jgi:hypothetical protein